MKKGRMDNPTTKGQAFKVDNLKSKYYVAGFYQIEEPELIFDTLEECTNHYKGNSDTRIITQSKKTFSVWECSVLHEFPIQ